MLEYLYLILLFPLAGLVLNLTLGGRYGNRMVGIVACSAVIGSFVVAAGSFLELLNLPADHRQYSQHLWTWFASGNFSADIALLFDPLSAVMCLVVTLVGALIHIYSTGYMHGDDGFRRFFVNLNLFTFSMLVLVLADNFLLLFVGWEGVGLCSYLLIGHWYQRHTAADAARKAFVVNRIGDFGYLLAMLLIVTYMGTLNFSEVFARAPGSLELGGGIAIAIALLLFLGATGKSAQLPLYVWLPDAMEGPTPVSALIHAATMVTAGVYMVARCSVIFELAPIALIVVAVIGAATAIFAATIGLVQNDIKRVLAYSTVSQLGFMFLACGVGAYSVAIFHLVTHAFFKALLFLGAGSVIHGVSDDQDMRRMGGLKKYMPRTHMTMLIACLAIAGIPPLAGFFSKDAILENVFAGGHYILFAVGLITAGLTAFYMFRLYFMTFGGKERMSDEVKSHLHESPPSMVVPLIVLALFTVVIGFLSVPLIANGDRFGNFLEPVFAASKEIRTVAAASHDAATAVIAGGEHGDAAGHSEHHLPVAVEITLMVLSVLVALIGIFVAYRHYNAGVSLSASLAERLRGVYRTLLNKYYVDEIYRVIIVRPLERMSSWLWRTFDVRIIDGLVDGVGGVVVTAGTILRLFQNGYVGTYAFFFVLGVVILIAQLVLN